MGLTISLEDEHGEPHEKVEDDANILHRLLPKADDPSSQVLRFIDWYGDTTFNHLQVPSFLAEWVKLKARSADDRILLDRVAALARRVEGTPHLYLKFYGD